MCLSPLASHSLLYTPASSLSIPLSVLLLPYMPLFLLPPHSLPLSPSLPPPLPLSRPPPTCHSLLQLLRLLFVCFLLSSSSLSFRVIAFVCFCSPYTAYIPLCSPLSHVLLVFIFFFIFRAGRALQLHTKAKAKHGRQAGHAYCAYTAPC